MSLVNQLIAAVIAVLIGLASGTLVIMSDSGKEMLLRQLESHAQDSATHLGLYISPYMAARDSAAIETAVNAIFDSGFYQRIAVTDPAGQPLYVKAAAPDIAPEVPSWFVRLIDIRAPKMERSIAHQWRQVGTIHVQSSAGYAYERFWQGTKRALVLFAVLALTAALLIGLLLRYLLKPLAQVEKQAQALARKSYIEQPQLPRTRELRSVVQAMNEMVRQVRQMFDEQRRNIEELRLIAYRDPLTGLANPRATLAQLQERIDYDCHLHPATLILLRIRDLAMINHRCGVDTTNHLLIEIANELKDLNSHHQLALPGRLSGAEFAVLTEQQPMRNLMPLLKELIERLNEQVEQSFDSAPPPAPSILIGIAHASDQGQSDQLLSQARLALKRAEERSLPIVEYAAAEGLEGDSQSWRQHVANAINNSQIFLQYQHLMDNNQGRIHGELLARILDENNEPCPAGRFICVARELGLFAAMDRAVISSALAYLQREPNGIHVAINLGQDSLLADDFLPWLESQLSHLSQPQRLQFEVNETVILNHTQRVQTLRTRLQALGIGFGVDNFGIHPSGFGYLYNLKPDYLKIDGSLIQEIDHNGEDRFFVRSLIGVAHNIHIRAYAEHVERHSQLEQLQALGIDGTQGYLHGRPEALG